MTKDTQLAQVFTGLLLFLLFALSLLFVLLFGAKAYKNTSDTLDSQYRERTCLNYLAAKIRHNQLDGNISLANFEGLTALSIEETIDGKSYTTFIYHYEGTLRELYMPTGSQLKPSDGLSVLDVDGLELSAIDQKLLKMVCTAGGREAELLVYLH